MQEKKEDKIQEKTWKEFKETGLFWFINSILHVFGWAIVMDISEKKINRVFPARTKYRGFTEKDNTLGYSLVTKYLKNNIDELDKDFKA